VESPDLTAPAYWNDPGIDIRVNPRLPLDTEGLENFLLAEGFASLVVLPTSGSGGVPKFVLLEKRALLASAAAVNAHARLTRHDSWLCPLATFHAGGLGIFARAHLSGANVIRLPWDEWEPDGTRFVEACLAHWIAVTSLTPVHLYDLVARRVRAPESLRVVFIGGGALSPSLAARAHGLGWPLWVSYGMTEAASQIATSSHGETGWLPVLDHWEFEAGRGSRTAPLRIRGPALFSGYAVRDPDGAWRLDNPVDEGGWFTTGDLCVAQERGLRFVARADDTVKILGELVSVSRVESELNEDLEAVGGIGAVVAIPEARRGHALVAFVEGGETTRRRAEAFRTIQPAVERVSSVVRLDRLPRTGVGKVDRGELRKLAAAGETA